MCMDSEIYQHQVQELNKKLRHHFSHLLRIEFDHFHITDMQYNVLSAIDEHDGITIGELAKLLQQDAGNMSNLLKKLERLAYVIRTRSAIDERVINLHLSKDGKHCVKAINTKLQTYYEKEWNRYNDKDKEIILHGLTKLNQFFESFLDKEEHDE